MTHFVFVISFYFCLAGEIDFQQVIYLFTKREK
jgi:hypothetical protein